MATEANFSRKLIYVLLNISLIARICIAESNIISHLEIRESSADVSGQNYHRIQRRDAPGDETCRRQESTFLKDIKTASIDKLFNFLNETKYSMALAWAGKNDGTLIIVTSETGSTGKTINSTVYESTDFGAHFIDVTKTKNIQKIIKKHNGIQRNPYDPKKVYLFGDGAWMYITEDGGKTYTLYEPQFIIEGEILFHASKAYDGYLLAKDQARSLYISWNNGITWKKIHENVETVYWGEPGISGDNEKTIYIASGASGVDPILKHFFNVEYSYTLMKSDDGGSNWTNIRSDVVKFERHGKFLYASVLKETGDISSRRLLQFSVDGGKNWREAKIPTMKPDQFYTVMDIEDNMVFMHVDDEDDTGHGTLYTSIGDGIIFTVSLERHLYPNFGTVHDFYKVKSMRGVYITSQMGIDDSIHTMITYNRGAEWQKIPRPPGVACKDESKGCYLQIHGMYSMKRDIKALPPVTEENAFGLILVHGHVADALQKTDPDVYVSNDGGYSWMLSLTGPHFYGIGDHGGLLVAVARTEPFPKIVKFSLDEGRCWHEYTFTNKNLTMTGLLTEPEGRSSVFMLWGYVSETRKWEVHVIDFKDVISRQCGNDDYEPWLEHAVYGSDKRPDVQGCLLGQKRTFLRLKKDSWCYNGYDHENTTLTKVCPCTIDDYDCDYGYFRPGGSEKCIEIPEFTGEYIEICLRGHEEKEISEGYRKISGDKCSGGFIPNSKKIVLSQSCDETSKVDVEFDEFDEHEMEKKLGISKAAKVLALIIVGAILLLAAVMGVYFIRKFLLLRRHTVEYRYSLLNAGEEAPRPEANDEWDHDLNSALATSAVRYQDSDEEELTTKVLPPSRRQASSQNGNIRQKDTNPFTSYHDDSDDDLLS